MKRVFHIVVFSLIFFSCNTNRGKLNDESWKGASEEVLTSNAFYNEVFSITEKTVDKIEIDENLKSGQVSTVVDTCADIVYHLSQDLSYVENITISYTDFACSPVGRRRLGKIHIHLTGLISAEGTVVTVSLEDFYVEHHKIEGTQTSTNKDVSGYVWEFEQKTENGKITLPSGDFLIWENEKNIKIDFLSKVTTYTGASSGISSQGIEFNSEVQTPLEKNFSCNYISTGSIKIELEDYEDLFIDYGNGTCDAEATITYDDKSAVVSIK